jgi:hypothetical protein
VLKGVVISEGIRGGAILGVLAVALGMAGLSPSLTWIPELLLLAAIVIGPAVVLGLAGYRAGSRSKGLIPGALAGALAGAIGGCVGGLTYLAFDKPALNVVLGTVAGAVGGAIAGAVGARFASRPERA